MKVVLADLDDTLFDHAGATRHALARLREMEPGWLAWHPQEFEVRHGEVLELLHRDVLTGRLTVEAARVERFRRLLTAAAADERAAAGRAVEIAGRYRMAYEDGWRPVPGAGELLRALVGAGIRVAVVTNNLVAEQRLKLDRCGFSPHIDALVTSEETGVAKPDPAIFEAALRRVEAASDEAVMLGDSWPFDIEGARATGIRAVWLNRLGVERPDRSVPELRSLEPAAEALRALVAGFDPHDQRSS